jgi:hypothetical protein
MGASKSMNSETLNGLDRFVKFSFVSFCDCFVIVFFFFFSAFVFQRLGEKGNGEEPIIINETV